MTAIIMISIIILVFAILLNIKIKAEISYLSGVFTFKVKYLCFTIFPFKEKKEKSTKTKKKDIRDEESISIEQSKSEQDLSDDPDRTDDVSSEPPTEQANNEKEKKNKEKKKDKSKEPLSDKIDKLVDIIEKVKIIWNVSKKHLLNIFKHIYIEELMIDFLVADEDAYNTAMNYGRINAAVYNLINLIRTFFTVTIKTVDIVCDFDAKEPIYDISTKITVKPATILSAAFGILFGLLINIKKLIGNKKKKQPTDKKAVSM